MIKFRKILPVYLIALLSCQNYIVSQSSINEGDFHDLVKNLPFSNKVQTLENDIVSRTATKSIEILENLLDSGENIVLSPSSLLLSIAGLSSVSDNFNNSAFGLSNDSLDDLTKLLKSWNFEYDYKNESDERYCKFQSAVLHQQVGPKFAFDSIKRQELSDKYISTMVSSLESYNSDAQYFFEKEVGLKIEVPDPNLSEDGVITYGALKIKDCVPGGLSTKNNYFNGVSSSKEVSTFAFGSERFPQKLKYYEGENYQSFKTELFCTDLLIILPNEGENIENISVSGAYDDFTKNATQAYGYGFIPYFHVTTNSIDLTKNVILRFNQKENFYSKLLKNSEQNDLSLSSALQSSDFEFNKYGVSGESITALAFCESTGPIEIDKSLNLEVNRPFYAICLKDNFPMFISKIIDL